ncbi:hypothetical protein [Natronorubrum daqingense]|uniref:Uncharacterized protein n=1 Tax=Natronorubrum daqingense TaxID=588898 RepID=A0A1N7FJJ7_9EURY|nr:hypothetical protein [Natronorubrum daqingense]SIS00457.1 hypothetical protein SAMN05421809_3286 [Natronorubrum daqingense]
MEPNQDPPADGESNASEEPATAGTDIVAPLPGKPTVTIAATGSDREATDRATNTLTIIGHGTPSSFELTVDGEIHLRNERGDTNVTIISGSTVEGTIEQGTIRFEFTGELTDVTFVDQQITGVSPATAPNVHLDYAAPPESRP